ncbi:ligand-dependent nuclear receptor-interacting factor 1 isoform X1 [Phascolarctos cinereus]|uniref:Ligand-dependent nuclear receptor-interacting factor 1 isoform X1 n=1 Tax=Phascolarctos cinereus TaxID=38626 RepID=A0A6P5LMA9_PHACI|nr:ligand-dependent nuclear receptor-interacting factor 1 isoform X1 [Phascolarctos cinereus]
MSNLPRVVLKPPEDVSGSAAPPCIAGCMYQVVQTTGLDGKNLLKLLPIPNSSGNLMPLVQSSVTSDTSKGNISNPVHVTIQTQLASTPTTASIQFPVFQTTNSGNYFLSRAVDKSENVRVTSVGKESLPSVSTAQSNATKVEKLALQKIAVSPSTTQGDTAYMLVNTKNLPVTVKSPVLPYGHHLQIPANAEVKSVPASSLPPPIQQKILAAAATNTSGTTEASKVPTVIYVSPVNTVKSVVSKTFKNICPKPPNPTEAAKPTVPNTSKTPAKNPATDVPNNEGQQSRDTPMKWVVRENPQCSPCLVPVKSSNNMASKILKTLMDMKNVETSSLTMPSLCSGTSSGTQAKITPIKDNALVMFNGKVYLLAKKGSEVLPSQTDQQNSAAPDASPRKDISQIPNSNSVTKITNEVVNIVLAKNKTAPLKETRLISDTQLASEPVPSLEKNNKVECTSLSAQSPHKQPLCLEQYKTMHIKLNLPDVVSSTQNAKKETSVSHTKDSSDDTTSTSKHCVYTDQGPKNQGEMAFVLETHTQSRNRKESCWREYAELRKTFGITKDLRVRLTRIPLLDSTSLYSPSSLTNSISSKESKIIVDLTSGKEEESQELTLQQDLDKKRKAKTVLKVDSTKRKKLGNDVNPSMDTGTDYASPQILNSISPDSALLPQSNNNNLIGCTECSEENSSELEPHAQGDLDRGADSPASVIFEQELPDSQDCYIDDSFPMTLPELDETIRDEKIKRLKQLLKEREAALEEIRKKMQQS